MVTTLAPFAIFAGVAATVFFVFFTLWNSLNRRATARVETLADKLDRAGIGMSPQEIVLTVSAGVAIVWLTLAFLLHLTLVVSLFFLPLVAAAGALGFYTYVQFSMRKRLDAFTTQLEPATRLIAGGLRVGLGVRQALAIVIDELADPGKHEFRRVIGQTNLGASIFDAMDTMTVRMPSHESLMLARCFRVQSETGGDLARILDQLADTIKDRRQIQRKISSLTAEGRMSAWVLMAIPIVLGLFIILTQQDMSEALLHTLIGHIVLLIVAALEVAAYFALRALLRINV